MSGRPPRFLGNPRSTFPRNVRPTMYPRAFTANPRGMYFPQPTAATGQQTFYDHQQFVQSDYRQQQQQQNVIYVTAQENQHQQQVVVLPQDGQQMYEVVPSSQADEYAQDQQYIQVLSDQTDGNVIQYAQPVQHHFIQPAQPAQQQIAAQPHQQLAPQGQQQLLQPLQQQVAQQPPQPAVQQRPQQVVQQVLQIPQQTYQHQTVTQDPQTPLFPQLNALATTVEVPLVENRQQQIVSAEGKDENVVNPPQGQNRQQQPSVGAIRQQQVATPLQTVDSNARVATPIHQTPTRRQGLSPVGNEVVVGTAGSTPRKRKSSEAQSPLFNDNSDEFSGEVPEDLFRMLDMLPDSPQSDVEKEQDDEDRPASPSIELTDDDVLALPSSALSAKDKVRRRKLQQRARQKRYIRNMVKAHGEDKVRKYLYDKVKRSRGESSVTPQVPRSTGHASSYVDAPGQPSAPEQTKKSASKSAAKRKLNYEEEEKEILQVKFPFNIGRGRGRGRGRGSQQQDPEVGRSRQGTENEGIGSVTTQGRGRGRARGRGRGRGSRQATSTVSVNQHDSSFEDFEDKSGRQSKNSRGERKEKPVDKTGRQTKKGSNKSDSEQSEEGPKKPKTRRNSSKKDTAEFTDTAEGETVGETAKTGEPKKVNTKRTSSKKPTATVTDDKNKAAEEIHENKQASQSEFEQGLEKFFSNKELDFTDFVEKAKGMDGKTLMAMLNIKPKKETTGEGNQVADGQATKLESCSVNMGQRVGDQSPIKVQEPIRLSEAEHKEEGEGNNETKDATENEHGKDNESSEGVTDAENEAEDGIYISDSDVCERLESINRLKEMNLNEEEFTAGMKEIEEKFEKAKAEKEQRKKEEMEKESELKGDNLIDGGGLNKAVMESEKKIANIKTIVETVSKEQPLKPTRKMQTARRGRSLSRGVGRGGNRSASEGSNVGFVPVKVKKEKRSESEGAIKKDKRDRRRLRELERKVVTTTVDPVRQGFIKRTFADDDEYDGQSDIVVVSEYDPLSSESDPYDGATEVESDAEKNNEKGGNTASAGNAASEGNAASAGNAASGHKPKKPLPFVTASDMSRVFGKGDYICVKKGKTLLPAIIVNFPPDEDTGKSYTETGTGLVGVNFFAKTPKGWILNSKFYTVHVDDVENITLPPVEERQSSTRVTYIFKRFPHK